MRFPAPLVPGRLVRRYKRFLSDVELAGGDVVTAHCPNPGAMLGLNDPGSEVWLLPAQNPAAKLRWSWELVRVGEHLVGLNTGRPNRIIEEAVRAGRIPELTGYETVRPEVKYGQKSRVDLLLSGPGKPPCWVEIKNVHLKRGAAAEFPDSVTARGTRHLDELGNRVEAGDRAVMVYVVQRADCLRFAVASDIDAAYAAAFRRASARGVEAICWDCRVTTAGIDLRAPLPIPAVLPRGGLAKAAPRP